MILTFDQSSRSLTVIVLVTASATAVVGVSNVDPDAARREKSSWRLVVLSSDKFSSPWTAICNVGGNLGQISRVIPLPKEEDEKAAAHGNKISVERRNID